MWVLCAAVQKKAGWRSSGVYKSYKEPVYMVKGSRVRQDAEASEYKRRQKDGAVNKSNGYTRRKKTSREAKVRALLAFRVQKS
jgi:hypothetical protein